jgi:TP901 family phage tail tape measure protein
MPGKLAILDVVLQVDKRGLATGLAQSRAMLRSETKSMAAEVGAAAATMAKAMAVPMLAISGFAVKMAADFDREMTKSIAIMGDVSAAMRKQMAQTAKDTARSLNLSATEMAKSYFYLASAGFDAAQSIGALPAVATFAKAGAFDLALAVDLLTDAQTALGMTAWDTAENLENLVRISDLLIGANTLANASTQQFSEALTNKAAASLKIYGKSLEEGLSVLAAFADAGKKGSEAGELLSRFITQIGKASLRNAEAWKQYGIAVFDAGGKMRDVADIVEDMEKAMEGLSDKQKDVMFTELGLQLRMKDTVQVLLGASDKMRGYQRRLEEMSGVTRDVAEKQMQTFHERLGLVLAEFRALAVQLGEELIPILETGLLPKLKDAGEFLRTLSSATKAAAWDFVSFAAKIIAATVALGALIRLAKANPLILAFAAGYGGGGLMAASYGAATQRGTDFLRDLQETEQILGTARGALHAPKLDPWVAANRHRAQEFGIPAGLGLDATDAQLSLHRPFPSGANADFLAGMPYGEALPLAFQAADFLRNLETTSPEMVEPMRKGLQTGEIDVNQLRQAIDALALVEQNAQAIDSVMNRVAETFAEAGDSAGGLADFDEEEIAEGAGSAVSDAILDSFPDEELRKRMIESAQALREHLFPVEFLKTQ